jgi:hypothetical protein
LVVIDRGLVLAWLAAGRVTVAEADDPAPASVPPTSVAAASQAAACTDPARHLARTRDRRRPEWGTWT